MAGRWTSKRRARWRRSVVLLAIFLVASCGPNLRPKPTTEQGVSCVAYCRQSVTPCKNGCLWWLAGGVLLPVLFACQGGCDRDYDRCEQLCPGMVYPQVSTTR